MPSLGAWQMAPDVVKSVICTGVAESLISKPHNGSRGGGSWDVGEGRGQGGVAFGCPAQGAKDTLSHTPGVPRPRDLLRPSPPS